METNKDMIIENEKNISFPSAKLLFSIIQKEHDYEFDRGKDLQTRTGMFLAFSGAILVFIFNNVKIPNLSTTPIINLAQVLPYVFLIVFLSMTLLSLLFAIFSFIKVISTKIYPRINLDEFSVEKIGNRAIKPEDQTLVVLIPLYKNFVEEYSKINNIKVVWFKRGIISILVALIFTTLTYSMLLFTR